jgi:hypothetical protein
VLQREEASEEMWDFIPLQRWARLNMMIAGLSFEQFLVQRIYKSNVQALTLVTHELSAGCGLPADMTSGYRNSKVWRRARESCKRFMHLGSHDRLVLRRYAVGSSIEEGKAEKSERILYSSQSQPLRYRTHRTSPQISTFPSHNNTPSVPHPQPLASITHFPHPFGFTNFPHSLCSGHPASPSDPGIGFVARIPLPTRRHCLYPSRANIAGSVGRNGGRAGGRRKYGMI